MSHIDKDKHNEYHRSYQKARYHKRKQEVFKKLGEKCAICDVSENLQIDHIDYTKKSFSISKLWGINEVSFWTEIDKCQLLCQTHHLEKTKEESKIRRPITHGKYWAAYKHKCTCTLCEMYKKETNLKRRQSRASNSIGRVPSF